MFKTAKRIFLINSKLFARNFSSEATLLEASSRITHDLEQKIIKVSIIGLPNAGKSTLINGLMDRNVCPTSSKVHTTRAKARAVLTEGDSQVIFLDTPGVVNFMERQRYKLERSFLKDHKISFQESDLIGVVHDVSNAYTRERLDIKIIKLLEKYKNIPSFLILNKVDVLKSKRKLLDWARILTENSINGKSLVSTSTIKNKEENRGWPYFQEVFMVSSLTGDGLDDVKDYLLGEAKPGQWMFPELTWTDQKEEDLIVQIVKAQLLNFLPQELPYNMQPKLELFEKFENGEISAVVLVECPSARIAKLAAGESDGRLKQITTKVQSDLQNAFQNSVRIKIVLEAPDMDE